LVVPERAQEHCELELVVVQLGLVVVQLGPVPHGLGHERGQRKIEREKRNVHVEP